MLSCHPGIKLAAIMKPVRPTDAPGAVCHPCSLEAYAASRVLEHQIGGRLGLKAVFNYPPKRYGGIYFAGPWTPKRDCVESAGGSTIMNYMAKDVFSVLRTDAAPIQVE